MAMWWDKYKCEDCGWIGNGDELRTVKENMGFGYTETYISCPCCDGDVELYREDDDEET